MNSGKILKDNKANKQKVETEAIKMNKQPSASISNSKSSNQPILTKLISNFSNIINTNISKSNNNDKKPHKDVYMISFSLNLK